MQSDGKIDNKLYIWDMELDTVQYFDFECGRGEQDEDMESPDENEDPEISDVDRCVYIIWSMKLSSTVDYSIEGTSIP